MGYLDWWDWAMREHGMILSPAEWHDHRDEMERRHRVRSWGHEWTLRTLTDIPQLGNSIVPAKTLVSGRKAYSLLVNLFLLDRHLLDRPYLPWYGTKVEFSMAMAKSWGLPNVKISMTLGHLDLGKGPLVTDAIYDYPFRQKEFPKEFEKITTDAWDQNHSTFRMGEEAYLHMYAQYWEEKLNQPVFPCRYQVTKRQWEILRKKYDSEILEEEDLTNNDTEGDMEAWVVSLRCPIWMLSFPTYEDMFAYDEYMPRLEDYEGISEPKDPEDYIDSAPEDHEDEDLYDDYIDEEDCQWTALPTTQEEAWRKQFQAHFKVEMSDPGNSWSSPSVFLGTDGKAALESLMILDRRRVSEKQVGYKSSESNPFLHIRIKYKNELLVDMNFEPGTNQLGRYQSVSHFLFSQQEWLKGKKRNVLHSCIQGLEVDERYESDPDLQEKQCELRETERADLSPNEEHTRWKPLEYAGKERHILPSRARAAAYLTAKAKANGCTSEEDISYFILEEMAGLGCNWPLVQRFFRRMQLPYGRLDLKSAFQSEPIQQRLVKGMNERKKRRILFKRRGPHCNLKMDMLFLFIPDSLLRTESISFGWWNHFEEKE